MANTPIHTDNSHIKIVAKKVPSKNRVKYEPTKPYLYYHKFTTTYPERHYFNIIFSSSSSEWAGEGELGNTVDTNISKMYNKSLDW